MKKNNISELRPGSARAEPSRLEQPFPAKRYARRSKWQRAERTVRKLQYLVAILVAILVIGAFAVGTTVQPLRAKRDLLSRERLRLERDLVLSEERLALMTAERDELVTTRIPGLEALVFGETIDVERKYLRNVLFTLTVQQGHPAYEFRVVLANNELTDIIPNVAVLLFNELGIQLGSSRISLGTLVSDTGSFKLAPGDVRSYSGQVELSDSGEPAYYVLEID